MKEKHYIWITITAYVLCFSGCSTNPAPLGLTPIMADVKLIGKAERIENSTEIIEEHTKQPEILLETEKINVVAKELRVDDRTVKEYQQRIANLEAELGKLKSEFEKSFQRMMSLGMYIGGLGIILGLICAVLGTKIPFLGGIGVLSLCCGLLLTSVCYSLASHSWVLVYVGIPLSLSALGFGVYIIIHNMRKDSVTKTAIVDMVKTVEIAKRHLPNWKDEVMPLVDQIQHPKSQDLIQVIKDTEVNNRRKYSPAVSPFMKTATI